MHHVSQLVNRAIKVREQETPSDLPEDAQGTPDPEVLQKTARIGPEELIELTSDWHRMLESPDDFEEVSIRAAKARVASLAKADRQAFDRMLAMRMMAGYEIDPEGAATLCGCASDLCTARHA